jgi:hypothetical protein
MRRIAILFAVAFLACGGGLSRDAVLTANVEAYRQTGRAIVLHAPGSCGQIRAELEAVRAAWLPVWAAVDASVPPLPEMYCAPIDGGTR